MRKDINQTKKKHSSRDSSSSSGIVLHINAKIFRVQTCHPHLQLQFDLNSCEKGLSFNYRLVCFPDFIKLLLLVCILL